MNRQLRIYRRADADDGSVHAIGNGHLLAYGKGPEWIQVIAPPYSSPTAFSLVPDLRFAEGTESDMDGLTGLWRHRLPLGEIRDCAAPGMAYLARHWQLGGTTEWRLHAPAADLYGNAADFPSCTAAYRLVVRAGTPIYNWYPMPNPQFVQLLFLGEAAVRPEGDGLHLALVGEGTLFVAGGTTWPDCEAAARAALSAGWQATLDAAGRDGAAFTLARRSRMAPLRDHPLRADAERAADEVAHMIRAQQDASGGILAGTLYHLAYVRDQYGTSRGLLALGCVDQARAILQFYRETFSRSGRLSNAQGAGVPNIFHVHENDAAEITGYLLLQAADLLRATGDLDFFLGLRPMLDWALHCQLASLHRDMLPFNGDETYVAGGLLPRETLCDGSLEATLLLLRGGGQYLEILEGQGIHEPWMETARQVLQGIRARFPSRFHHGGQWVTNSLDRLEGLAYDPFRHGVCLGCSAFGWTRHQGDGIYLCPACLAAGRTVRRERRQEYVLKNVPLMEPYVSAGILPASDVRAEARRTLEEYRETGRMPSRPDSDVCLGYDYGLLLYAAAVYDLSADDLLERMLQLRDASGAWVEYYVNGVPRGTRCRPWESGINIEAALAYLRRDG